MLSLKDDGSLILGSGVALAFFVLDQGTKALALVYSSELVRSIEILPVLNLVLVRNAGVSFGLLGMLPAWVLVLFSLVVVAGLGWWHSTAGSRVTAGSLGLIIGGALGNIVDRVRFGGVTDFLDVHWGVHHWPAFNLADTAIFCGAALLILECLRGARE